MSMFDNQLEKLTKKMADADEAARAANEAARTAASEATRIRSDVANRSPGGVATVPDQLAIVIAERDQIYAEDEARRRTSEQSQIAHKLGVAKKDPAFLARDPEGLLADLTRIATTIQTHEAALSGARQAWGDRMRDAHASLAQAESQASGGGPAPIPLPAPTDEIGRPLGPEAYVEALAASVGSRDVSLSRTDQYRSLAARETELRATIEREHVAAVAKEKERADRLENERLARETADRELAEQNAASLRAAKAVAAENERLAAANRARTA